MPALIPESCQDGPWLRSTAQGRATSCAPIRSWTRIARHSFSSKGAPHPEQTGVARSSRARVDGRSHRRDAGPHPGRRRPSPIEDGQVELAETFGVRDQGDLGDPLPNDREADHPEQAPSRSDDDSDGSVDEHRSG